jgi:hypothetical protein
MYLFPPSNLYLGGERRQRSAPLAETKNSTIGRDQLVPKSLSLCLGMIPPFGEGNWPNPGRAITANYDDISKHRTEIAGPTGLQ